MEIEIMEIFGSFLEAVSPHFEGIGPHLLDIIVGGVLGIAFIIGIFKTWRGTLMALLLQWVSLGLSFLLAWLMAPIATNIIMGIDMISDFFEGALGAAQLQQVMGAAILLILSIFTYALIGSLVFAFTRKMNWERLIFPKLKLHNALSRFLSGLFAALNTYTYVFFFLALMALPMFDIIQEGSIAAVALEANVIGAPLVETITEPISDLYNAIDVVENELSDIVVGGVIQYDAVADIINNDPARLAEIVETLEDGFLDIPEEAISEMWDFVLQEGDVTPEEVRTFFLTQMGQLQ